MGFVIFYIFALIAFVAIMWIATCFKGADEVKSVCSKFGAAFSGLGLWLKNYLMGTTFDKDADQWRSMKESDDMYKKEQKELQVNFLAEKRKGYGSFLFDETKDCPICIVPFTDTDDVIALPCNTAHVLHVDCMEKMMEKSYGSYHECPTCREMFTYTDEPAAEGEEEPAMEAEDDMMAAE